MATDEELEAALRKALPPIDDGTGPSRARIDALRAEAASAGPSAPVVALPLERRPRRWRVVTIAAAAAAVAFVAGVAVDPPDPVRDAAHDLGLPVDSSDLVAARAELDRLGDALAAATAADVAGEPDEAQFAAVADADAAMVGLARALGPDEKSAFVPVAHQVHLRAVALFEAYDRRLPSASPSDIAEVDAPGG